MASFVPFGSVSDFSSPIYMIKIHEEINIMIRVLDLAYPTLILRGYIIMWCLIVKLSRYPPESMLNIELLDIEISLSSSIVPKLINNRYLCLHWVYKFPRRVCSRSKASNRLLKFLVPKPSKFSRWMISRKTVGRSTTCFVNICSR